MEWWSGGVMEWWSDGVVEWWSDGVVEWWSDGLTRGHGVGEEDEAVSGAPAFEELRVVGRRQDQRVRRPDFGEVRLRDAVHLKTQDGRDQPGSRRQQVIPCPVGGGSGEDVAGPPHDDLLEHIVPAYGELAEADFRDADGRVGRQGVRAKRKKRVEGVKAAPETGCQARSDDHNFSNSQATIWRCLRLQRFRLWTTLQQ